MKWMCSINTDLMQFIKFETEIISEWIIDSREIRLVNIHTHIYISVHIHSVEHIYRLLIRIIVIIIIVITMIRSWLFTTQRRFVLLPPFSIYIYIFILYILNPHFGNRSPYTAKYDITYNNIINMHIYLYIYRRVYGNIQVNCEHRCAPCLCLRSYEKSI